ncbi:MAG TPA: hypothetical protein DCS67_12065 [Clostridiales bacterium UBA8960]|jgi:hypothetical protein|nr:hypothetical protein [Clostridiales bacterium UBA8960]
MLFNRKMLLRAVMATTLMTALIFLNACAVKEGPLPVETDETTMEVTTEPDIRKVLLLEDAQQTEGWQLFKDDGYGLFGFKDQNGNVVIEPTFLDAEQFEGGRAIVKVASDQFIGILEGGVYGLIDPEGMFIVEPEGLITRVDQWHYLYASGDDYFPAYGLDGLSMMKRTFLDGNGQALGDERYYYVEAIRENLFLANTGLKSVFIDGDGMLLKKFPEFEFAVTSKVTGDSINLVPMDEPSGRIRYVLSGEGEILEQQNESETLIDGVTFERRIISAYIGSSVIYPVLTMNDKAIQDKLNQAILNFATEAMWETDMTGAKIEDYEVVERIEQTVVNEFSLSLRDNLMNVKAFGYFYGFGAAHPNSFQSTRYLDFSTGEVLSLDILFKDNPNWRLAIVKEVDRQFMADDEAYLFIDKTQPEAERLKTFYDAHFEITFEEDFMTVYFPVYEIAPYAAGIPSYEVPYSVLDE